MFFVNKFLFININNISFYYLTRLKSLKFKILRNLSLYFISKRKTNANFFAFDLTSFKDIIFLGGDHEGNI